jgi:hypothetical protein
MALKKPYVFASGRVVITDAYHKISRISVRHDRAFSELCSCDMHVLVDILVFASADARAANPVEPPIAHVNLDLSEAAFVAKLLAAADKNEAWALVYARLKTLPDYAHAVDC